MPYVCIVKIVSIFKALQRVMVDDISTVSHFHFLDRANYFFLGLFSFEMILKIYCLGFSGYCRSLFNRFDGLVSAIVCLFETS